jgi:hypothetical protein
VNLEWQGRPFFAADADRLAAHQVQAYLAQDQSFIPGVATYSDEDEVAVDRSRAIDTAFGEPLMMSPRPFSVPKRYAPTMVVFGVGLGLHLPMLLDSYDVLHLVLYEADAEILKATLYSIDWTDIVRRFRGAGRSLTLIADPDPIGAANGILGKLRALPPALIVGSRYFRLYESPIMDQAAAAVAGRLPFLGFGWGYFKDERRQVLQTKENVAGASRWLRRRWPKLPGADAVVVGAGPSLDQALPLLRAVRDRVVVFSGGSAIRALVRAGIEPDFHVELETAPVTTDMLAEIPDRSFFDRVTLLAANGMVPSTLPLFVSKYLFTRENSTSALLISDVAEPAPNCYPIVGNAAVGVAAALGFRRIALFGIDFGYRDTARHHASGTIYIDDASGRARADLAEVGLGHVPVADYTDTRHRLVSTQGDELLSDNVFSTSLLSMEQFVSSMPDLELIQCGNGARIAGAHNVPPEGFGTLAFAGNRSSALAALAPRFEMPPLDEREYGRRMAQLADGVDHFARRARRILADRQLDTLAYARRIGAVWELLDAERQRAPAVASLLTGLLSSYFKATMERSLMASTPPDRVRFIEVARTQFHLLMDDVGEALAGFRR